jgi:hypothetical protein
MSVIDLTNLKKIKKDLENKDLMDTDSSVYKKNDISHYIIMNEKLESKIHYMKLDIVNKDIQIKDLQDKDLESNKLYNFLRNSEFLFDRLDNAHTVLSERLNSKPLNDSFKYIVYLENTLDLCSRTITKYQNFIQLNLTIEMYPNQKYTILAVESLYAIKNKELLSLHDKIKQKIFYIKFSHFVLFFNIFIICIFIVLTILLKFFK